MRWWKNPILAFNAYREKQAYDKRHKETLSKYGWDGICAGCEQWLFTDNRLLHVWESDWYWHHLCVCGHLTHWGLWGMCPIADPDWGDDNPVAYKAMVDEYPVRYLTLQSQADNAEPATMDLILDFNRDVLLQAGGVIAATIQPECDESYVTWLQRHYA